MIVTSSFTAWLSVSRNDRERLSASSSLRKVASEAVGSSKEECEPSKMSTPEWMMNRAAVLVAGHLGIPASCFDWFTSTSLWNCSSRSGLVKSISQDVTGSLLSSSRSSRGEKYTKASSFTFISAS